MEKSGDFHMMFSIIFKLTNQLEKTSYKPKDVLTLASNLFVRWYSPNNIIYYKIIYILKFVWLQVV